MRELLFRGKRTDNNKLVEGWLVVIPVDKDRKDSQFYIITEIDFRDSIYDVYRYAYEVDPNTVGRFTCLSDKNGKRIFEGDIVKRHAAPMLVKWDDESASFIVCYYFHGKYYENTMDGHMNLEVIGNIHDNPELIG